MKRVLFIRHLPDAKPPECVCHPRWDCEHSTVNPQLRDPCLCITDLPPEGEGPPDASPVGAPPRPYGSDCFSPWASAEEPECGDAGMVSAPPRTSEPEDSWGVMPRFDTLGPIVARFAPDFIVTSPLRRAIMTTGIIFQAYDPDVKIVVHPGAREKNHKKKVANWPLPLDRLKQVLKAVPRGEDMDLQLMEEVGNISGHEDIQEANRRVDDFAAWLHSRPERAIAVVAHGGVIKHLLAMRQAPAHGSAIECVADEGRLLLPVKEFLPREPGSPQQSAPPGLSFCFVHTLPWSPTISPTNSAHVRPLTLDLEGARKTPSSDSLDGESGDRSTPGEPDEAEVSCPALLQLLSEAEEQPVDDGGLAPFAEQVSGRHLMFNTPEGVLYKEADTKEVEFYNTIAASATPLRPYIAQFFCVETIHGSELLKAKRRAMRRCALCSNHAAAPSNPRSGACAHSFLACRLLQNFDPQLNTLYQFVALRDVTRDLVRPCVMDIKMGRRQYGYDASEAKRQSKELKTRQSTSRNLFFRICGFKVYKQAADHVEQALSVQKEQAQQLTKHQMQRTLESFFDNGHGVRRDVLQRLLPRLEDLFVALQQQREWHFITSSLLLVYDGEPTRAHLSDVCMIDFAHTERVVGSLDVEYLYALANLIDVMGCILRGTEYEPPSTPPAPWPPHAVTAAAVERVLRASPYLEPRVLRAASPCTPAPPP